MIQPYSNFLNVVDTEYQAVTETDFNIDKFLILLGKYNNLNISQKHFREHESVFTKFAKKQNKKLIIKASANCFILELR